MTMLERDLDAFLEPDGVNQVETIAVVESWDVLLVHDGSVELVGVALHAPGVAEVVFHPGAVQAWWPRVVVDENHVVALTPPRPLEVPDGQIAPDVMAPAFGLESDVVVFTVEIRNGRLDAV